jgi:hypothetical protein
VRVCRRRLLVQVVWAMLLRAQVPALQGFPLA